MSQSKYTVTVVHEDSYAPSVASWSTRPSTYYQSTTSYSSESSTPSSFNEEDPHEREYRVWDAPDHVVKGKERKNKRSGKVVSVHNNGDKRTNETDHAPHPEYRSYSKEKKKEHR